MKLRTVLFIAPFLIAPLAPLAPPAFAATLEVGPNKPFDTLEKALAAAKKGDEIAVYPLPNDKPYPKTALLIKTPNLTIKSADKTALVKIDGAGFDYSGAGRIPRAIFQFDPAANDCTLEGFELTNAHNNSHNGAGVRINAANHITLRRCTIRGNDMGIMSNGELKAQTGANQLIEYCLIEKNGDLKDPGFNHNLYLGGTSVTVRGCEIAASLTGHNLKSRAHQNWIEYNFIHDSANRELDLVDAAGNTDAASSDTVLLGNIIRKSPNMSGNKTVIHFGKDGKADHTGTLWLVHNTITTDYISPVIDLSSPGATAIVLNNLFDAKDYEKLTLFKTRDGAKDPTQNQGNLLVNPRKGPTTLTSKRVGEYIPWDKTALPWEAFHKKPEPLLQYIPDRKVEPRPAKSAGDIGALAPKS